MITATQTTRMFKAWLAEQPDDDVYDYGDNNNCAIATMLRETGVCKRPIVGTRTFDDMEGKLYHMGAISERLDRAVGRHLVTVREIKERLNAL